MLPGDDELPAVLVSIPTLLGSATETAWKSAACGVRPEGATPLVAGFGLSFTAVSHYILGCVVVRKACAWDSGYVDANPFDCNFTKKLLVLKIKFKNNMGYLSSHMIVTFNLCIMCLLVSLVQLSNFRNIL